MEVRSQREKRVHAEGIAGALASGRSMPDILSEWSEHFIIKYGEHPVREILCPR